MSYLNRWTGIGNLVKLPDLRYMPNGTAVCTLRIACTEKWKDKNSGEEKEKTLFIDCNVFGKSAEAAKQYIVDVGTSLLIEGRLQQDEWTDKQGAKRSTISVNTDKWQFMGGKREKEAAPEPASGRKAGPSKQWIERDDPTEQQPDDFAF